VISWMTAVLLCGIAAAIGAVAHSIFGNDSRERLRDILTLLGEMSKAPDEVKHAEIVSGINVLQDRTSTGWKSLEDDVAQLDGAVGRRMEQTETILKERFDTLTKQQADQWRSITNSIDRIHGGEPLSGMDNQFGMLHAGLVSIQNLIESNVATKEDVRQKAMLLNGRFHTLEEEVVKSMASAGAIATAIGDRLTNPTRQDCPTCHTPLAMPGDSPLERAVKESFYSEGLGKILSEASRGSAVESPRGPKARKP
jgi:hypothetical protein